MKKSMKTTLVAGSKKPVEDIRPAVVKIGGSALGDESILTDLAHYIRELHDQNDQVVIVHGGGTAIASLQEKLGLEARMVDGVRVTDEADLEAVTMALAGKMNKSIVVELQQAGIPSVGITGIDGGLLRSPLDTSGLGRVGSRPRLDSSLLDVLLQNSMVPVLAPVSLGDDGMPINVNADLAASAVAAGLGAGTLEYIGQVDGVLCDGEVLDMLDESRIAEISARGEIREGMIPKLQGALAALAGGVSHVRIGSLESLEANTATLVRPPRLAAEMVGIS